VVGIFNAGVHGQGLRRGVGFGGLCVGRVVSAAAGSQKHGEQASAEGAQSERMSVHKILDG
jgi:hypothetical protein